MRFCAKPQPREPALKYDILCCLSNQCYLFLGLFPEARVGPTRSPPPGLRRSLRRNEIVNEASDEGVLHRFGECLPSAHSSALCTTVVFFFPLTISSRVCLTLLSCESRWLKEAGTAVALCCVGFSRILVWFPRVCEMLVPPLQPA